MTWWPEWYELTKQNNATGSALSITMDNVSIYRHKDIFVALFDQKVRSQKGGEDESVGTRKLFIRDRGEDFHIVGDEYQVSADGQKEPVGEQLLLSAYRKLGGVQERESKIEDMIDEWLQAWSSKDIQRYGEYYARNFRSQGMNRKSWLQYKNRLNDKYEFIQVSKEKLQIQKGEDRSVVTFLQTYKSSALTNVGVKRLVLVREDGRWKIWRETWKKR